MSNNQAKPMLPHTAAPTATPANNNPEGSKAKQGNTPLDRKVKIGENNRIGKVLLPTKTQTRSTRPGNRLYIHHKKLMQK